MKFFSLLLLPAMTTAFGVSWFGFETDVYSVHQLWCNSLRNHVDLMASINVTLLRIPVSEDFIMSDWDTLRPKDGTVLYEPEKYMLSIEVLDYLFDELAKHKISVVLDMHRLWVDGQAPQMYVPGDQVYTMNRFKAAWQKLLARYGDRIEGIDIFNEYQSADPQPWIQQFEEVIMYIEEAFPGNTWTYYVQGVRWGGDLSFVRNYHSTLPPHVMKRVVWTVHKYCFSDPSLHTYAELEQSWRASFGFLAEQGLNITIGEYGFVSTDPTQISWATYFYDYLSVVGIREHIFWSWNANSWDTGGLLLDDCRSLDEVKLSLILELSWKASDRHPRQLQS